VIFSGKIHDEFREFGLIKNNRMSLVGLAIALLSLAGSILIAIFRG
jgi:hypothetical protein